MNREYDYYECEFATAIAAAAFSIHSAEEAFSKYQNNYRDGIEIPIISSKVKTRKESSFRAPESHHGVSRRFSHKDAKDAVESSTKKRMESIAGRAVEERSWSISTRRRGVEGKADAWEKSAMEKIRKRFEKLNSAILAWEKEKKLKTKLDMERKQRELDLRRKLNLQHYQNKLARIDHIAGEARMQMEEKRKNEESEVKEKKRWMRSTGKVPFSCFRFGC